MQHRGLVGAFLILVGLALILGGIWINLASERPYWRLRLIGSGVVLLIAGVWILVRPPSLAHESSVDHYGGPRARLFGLAAISLGGSIFLTVYAIRKADDRGISLLIAAGILIVGIGSFFLARRMR